MEECTVGLSALYGGDCEKTIEELRCVGARDSEHGAVGDRCDGGRRAQQRAQGNGDGGTHHNLDSKYYRHTAQMSSSCDALLAALKTCLLESDCVQTHGRLPSECLKQHADELPEACRNLRKAAFECKRNMASLGLPTARTCMLTRRLSWI